MIRANILVIDDEPQIRRVVKNALEDAERRVHEACFRARGAGCSRIDMIVLDLGLPDMTGLEVCRDVRGWTSGILADPIALWS